MAAGRSSTLLSEFLVYLGAELQLSKHTVAAYRRDVAGMLGNCGDGLPDRARIVDHLRGLRSDYAPASVVRALAAIRGFFRFLLGAGHIVDDPTEGMLGPRLEQRLPPVLSRQAVEALLDAFPAADPLSKRNRTILHTFYATGCRVSELASLTTHSFVLDHRCLRVSGKGRKERLVPLSPAAHELIEAYLRDVRPTLAARSGGRDKDHLFLSRTGRPLDRIRLYQVLKIAGDRVVLMRQGERGGVDTAETAARVQVEREAVKRDLRQDKSGMAFLRVIALKMGMTQDALLAAIDADVDAN